MARPHGKTASTSRDRDVSPPEYRQYGTGNPGALSRGTQKKRAEQIAKHSQRMLADLEEEAENKWHLQNPVQAAIRRGRCFDEREPQSVPNDGAADGHRDQQAGPSTSARNDRNNDYAAGRSDGVALRGSSNVLTPTIRPGPSRRTEGGQRRAS